MPNCFQLLDLATLQPVNLQQVDNDMARHFGELPDPELWFDNWYNTIGFGIAMGRKPEELRQLFDDPWVTEVIDYLVGRYEWDAWASR
jgi:hypothetical protein